MYLGMGAATNCPGPGCTVGAWDESPASTADYAPQLQAQIDALYAYTHAGEAGATEPVPVSKAPTVPAVQWFKGVDNSTVLIAGCVVAVAVFMGRRR